MDPSPIPQSLKICVNPEPVDNIPPLSDEELEEVMQQWNANIAKWGIGNPDDESDGVPPDDCGAGDDIIYPDIYGEGINDEDKVETFSMTFRSWEEWLAMQIHPDTLSALPPAKIIACCLWEMSYISNAEEEIQARRDHMLVTIGQIEEGLSNGTIQYAEDIPQW